MCKHSLWQIFHFSAFLRSGYFKWGQKKTSMKWRDNGIDINNDGWSSCNFSHGKKQNKKTALPSWAGNILSLCGNDQYGGQPTQSQLRVSS